MTTYAERHHAYWLNLYEAEMGMGNEVMAQAAHAVAEAIAAYQPFDFQPGHGFDSLLIDWRRSPKTLCRSLALAALVDIQHAIKEYEA